MIEHEYSFKVKDINKYIDYCTSNNFTLESKHHQIRHLYKNGNSLARITIEDNNIVLDYKEDNPLDKIYKEAKESKEQHLSLEKALFIVNDKGYKKFNELERIRTIYSKDKIKYEIDEYKRPEKCFVIAIEGDKDLITKEYQKHCNYYRYTYNNIGIYEAIRINVSHDTWQEILKSNKIKWLPKPTVYEESYKSYFTKKGYKLFIDNVKPLFSKYVDFAKVKEECLVELDNIIYEDEYQVITK